MQKVTLLIMLYLAYLSANAQSFSKGNLDDLFLKRHRYLPHLDSTMDVTKLSADGRNALVEKLYAVDQMYRDSLMRIGWQSKSDKANHFVNLIMINDPVNQAVFLKLLRRYGWPCDKFLSHKAWFIVWHTRDSYEQLSKFYPYLVKANQIKCVNANQFKDVHDKIVLMRQ